MYMTFCHKVDGPYMPHSWCSVRSVTGKLGKAQSAANVAELSDGTITTEVDRGDVTRQLAGAVLEADGFLHSIGEKVGAVSA